MNTTHTLIIAIIAMTLLTALSRLLPFWLPKDSPIMQFFSKKDSPIAPLGGAVIIAMTVMLGSEFAHQLPQSSWVAFGVGVITTIIATLKKVNTGLTVLIGMMTYLVVKLMWQI